MKNSPAVDFLIVGAGFSGLTLAERLTTQLGRSCLVVERRNHIGGNAYDHIDEAGVLIHTYGPHYFGPIRPASANTSRNSPTGIRWIIKSLSTAKAVIGIFQST
jgi:phytoene dehydrogenase-like protein